MSDDFDARVRARIAATGETKARAQAWVWVKFEEQKYACAREECAHQLRAHDHLGPDDVTHRCAVADCACPGFVTQNPIVEATLPCSDCGIAVGVQAIIRCWTSIVAAHLDEHVGRCCDCFDELLGMPCEKRLVPRPPR